MRKFLYWLLAVVITIALSVYQRMTGPTHPQKVAVELNGTSYQQKLPRSGVQRDEVLKLKDIPQSTLAQLHYRQYPTNNAYTTVDFEWKDNQWQAFLPVQPVGGKLQYYITVGGRDYLADEPVMMRFRNDVPAGILVPHILLMFAAMLFAVYTLMLVLTRKKIQPLVEDNSCHIVCGRIHLRAACSACCLRSLVDGISLRYRPDRQQDPAVVPLLPGGLGHAEVEAQQVGGQPGGALHDSYLQHSP